MGRSRAPRTTGPARSRAGASSSGCEEFKMAPGSGSRQTSWMSLPTLSPFGAPTAAGTCLPSPDPGERPRPGARLPGACLFRPWLLTVRGPLAPSLPLASEPRSARAAATVFSLPQDVVCGSCLAIQSVKPPTRAPGPQRGAVLSRGSLGGQRRAVGSGGRQTPGSPSVGRSADPPR